MLFYTKILMRWLIFVARTTLICNLFFVACIVLRYVNTGLSQQVKGFIIIVGYPLSIVLNIVLHIMLAVFLIKRIPTSIPRWLVFLNLLLFFIQILYLSLF